MIAPLFAQAPAWHAGVAKVTVRADLQRQPGAAFVVVVEEGTAYLVTSAHVVEGDPNPRIEFVEGPRKHYKSTVRHVEGGERHGLALLEVGDPPASVRALQPAPRPVIGQRVTAAGFPVSFGSFTALETTVATFRGRELVLGLETGEGFSGGPVLSESGGAIGLVFGHEPNYGLAVQAAEVRTYLEGQGLSWGSQQPSVPKAGEVRRNPDDGQNYVWIPPGEFQMGCSPGDNECYEDEKPPHKVTITHGFWLGKTEVTVNAYRMKLGFLMTSEPVFVKTKLNPRWSDGEQPIVGASWTQAKSFCEAGAKGRLPTEAEWEYAARAGSSAARYGELDNIAWHAGNSGTKSLDARRAYEQDAGRDWNLYASIVERNHARIHKITQREPNSWGLHDMLGNVWEWVADWFEAKYYETLSLSSSVDPQGPTAGTARVARGGSFVDIPNEVRASGRGKAAPDSRDISVGFRCARDVIP